MTALVRGNWKGTASNRITGRELEFILCVADGMTDKEIAREVGLAPDSVKKRVANAMYKLGVNRRAALIAEAMRKAIIAPLVILLCSLCAFQTFLDIGHMQRAPRTARTQSTRTGRRDVFDNSFDYV